MPHLSREGAGPGPRGACRVQSMFFCTAQVAGDLFLEAVTSAWTGQPSSMCLVPSAGERGMGPVSPTETKPPIMLACRGPECSFRPTRSRLHTCRGALELASGELPLQAVTSGQGVSKHTTTPLFPPLTLEVVIKCTQDTQEHSSYFKSKQSSGL